MIRRDEPERILSGDEDARVSLEVGEGDELAPRWWEFVVACSALGSSREGKAASCYLDEANTERGLSAAAAGGRDGRESLVDSRGAVSEVDLWSPRSAGRRG